MSEVNVGHDNTVTGMSADDHTGETHVFPVVPGTTAVIARDTIP